jgi:hypothetical protein
MMPRMKNKPEQPPIAQDHQPTTVSAMKKIAISTFLQPSAKRPALACGTDGVLHTHHKLDALKRIGENVVAKFPRPQEWESFLLISVGAIADIHKRRVDREEWEAAFLQWRSRHPSVTAILHYRADAMKSDPATLGLVQMWARCFAHGADLCFYVDPAAITASLTAVEREDYIERLSVRISPETHLTLLDYEPVALAGETDETDIRLKKGIETEVKAMLLERFPGIANMAGFGEINRIRSEFNVVSKQLHAALSESRILCAYDVGLQALYLAWKKGWQVDRHDVGQVPESKTYTGMTQKFQLNRVAFQLDNLLLLEGPPVFSQGGFCAAYAIPEGIPIADRLAALYASRVRADDPLFQLLAPIDQRGEVNAWGGPHFTLLDALTIRDLKIFQGIVRDVCSKFSPPTITATGLVIWSGKSLVLRCESPELDRVRAALIEATRSCIERAALSDEEVQKARWWIMQQSRRPQFDLPPLDDALRVYAKAGRPPLPTSRHFRLGFLVKLVKEWRRAPEAERSSREGALSHFLTFGEPPWYAGGGALHLTLASGLATGTNLEALKQSIEPGVLADFPPTQLRRIALMTEDSKSTVQTSFFDWLTETPIREERPGFVEDTSATATFASLTPVTGSLV